MKKYALAAGVITALLCLAVGPALAKSLYVETWGEDNPNVSCSRTAPCETIDYVVGIAGPRDRIIVGPGTFAVGPTGLVITQPGLRLISAAGAGGTELVQDNSSTVPLIEVQAEKVVIGQRRKGFTLRSTVPGEDEIAVHITAGDRARVEGNIFITDIESHAGTGIASDTARNTVRGNFLSGFGFAISLNTETLNDTRHIVANNRVEDANGSCIGVASGSNGSNRIYGNVAWHCGALGISVIATGQISRDRIYSNMIHYPAVLGVALAGGNPTIQRNTIRGGNNGIMTGDFGLTTVATIRDNVLVDFLDGGLVVLEDSLNTVIQGNTIVGGDFSVILPRHEGATSRFSRNNLLNSDICPYDIDGDDDFTGEGTDVIVSDRNFHDTQEVLDGELTIDCGAEVTASNAQAHGFLEISRPATRPNPVRGYSDL